MQSAEHLPSNQDMGNSGTARKNMHEGVEVWEDTCVCEAEPRWRALGEELESQERKDNEINTERKR